MSDIPPEIIPDILCPLPVKSLLRFRCVCKSWKSLIDSPNFIKAHLTRQQLVKPNSDFKLILQGDSLFSIDFSSISGSNSAQPQQLDHPLKHPNGPSTTQIVASCNGLLFLRKIVSYSNVLDDIGLLNPSTNMFLRLPVCPFERPRGIAVIQYRVGFGYDASNDDYKVVEPIQWLNRSGDGSIVSQAMIYSLKLGSWKKAPEGCPYWLDGNYPVFAGGVLHWIQAKRSQIPLNFIGFDLANERFQEVPCPEILGEQFLLELAVLGECLCLFTNHLSAYTDANDFVVDSVDIWVMKDYGVKESWVKLFSVEQLDGSQHFSYVKPTTYSVTGKEILLEMDSKFWWYNPEIKSLKPVEFSGGLKFSHSHICLGTLVPLYNGRNGCVSKKNVEPNEVTGGKNIRIGDDFLEKGFKLKL